MFGAAARIAARPAAAAAAAGVAANAAQGSAQARAPAQSAGRQAVHAPVHNNKLVDRDVDSGWLDVQLKDEVVLFQPFNTQELDQAADTVLALFGGAGPSTSTSASTSAGPIVTEPEDADGHPQQHGSGRSSDDGGAGSDLADAYIEAAAAANARAVAAGHRAREREQLEGLMAITTRLLRRPGMQREVVLCMLEDTEVRELMMRQCSDLDRYLLAAGIHTPQLLPPAAAAAAEGLTSASASSTFSTTSAASAASATATAEASTNQSPPQSQQGGGVGGPGGLVSKLVGAVAGAIERAGDALACLGGWVRRHLAASLPFVGPADHQPQATAGAWGEAQEGVEEEGVQEQGGGGRARRGGAQPKRGADLVLGGVMALAVAVFAVAVIRRPLVLRQLSRSFR
ncbi:hypothetical protein CHLRE_09g392050v5 [Chlamydomonas reinhardtii]|uniref:Uncharacterized protein n=1 Tax=Chlamydomonas reinhardtii TaxID=3055 RepID=A0A2K3DDG2_CHLRE|nr:uncharacterized protein CHLRE_09g392050v5 [Chlamydomonas reinhardtii]PNW78566.1 hypothetical protein CHLRE_09g392050v5 [Chlamydomonas reinhardtii]